MSRRKCCICGLKEHKQEGNRVLFAQFPLDPNRCREWVKLVGDEDLVHVPIEKLNQLRYVCGHHFDKSHFNYRRTRLKKYAVPALNLPPHPLTDDQLKGFPRYISTSGQQCDVPTTSSQSEMISGDKEGDDVPSQPEPAENNEMTTAAVATSSVSEAGPSGSTVETPATLPLAQRVAKPTVKRKSETYSTPKKKKNVPLERMELTPRKKKLLEQLKKTKCEVKSLKKSAKLIENIDSVFLKQLVLSTLSNQHKPLQGRRWTTQLKIAALTIFKRSPKTYRYLQNVMPLPSIKTLQNVLRKIPMEPGLNPVIMDHLKSVAEASSDNDKLFALLFDEISLKQRLIYNEVTDQVDGYEDVGKSSDGCGRSAALADHALVFMLQGIHQKKKQPIAYYLVHGTISSSKLYKIIKEVIQSIHTAGLRVLTTVCDQGPTNRGALNLLKKFTGSNENDNFFFIDKTKIFIIYDIPHLFKSIRNNFLNSGQIIFDGKKAQWSHLVDAEKKNSESFLYLGKISPIHVNPKFRTKMKVKYAAQILSNTVSAVLKLMSEINKGTAYGSEMLETAMVVQDLDRLFDYTNGPSGPSDTKAGQRVNVSGKTDHVKVWTDYCRKLSNLKFVKADTGKTLKNVQCIRGYIISLKSLQDIYNYVHSVGFKFLNLRQLNQDALENLFGLIRQHSPTNKNPTCSHFRAALRTSILSAATAPHSRGSNCEKDNNTLLLNFHNLVFKSHAEPDQDDRDHDDRNPQIVNLDAGASSSREYSAFGLQDVNTITEQEYPVLSLEDEDFFLESKNDFTTFEEQPIVYVSGYLASTLLRNNNCKKCQECLKVEDPASNPMYSYIKLREWWKDRTALTYPSINLCRLVECAVQLFENDICLQLHQPNISQIVKTLILSRCDIKWLNCSQHSNLMITSLITRLCLLLIRRQCQRINQGLALREEELDSKNKKAQQQGIAK